MPHVNRIVALLVMLVGGLEAAEPGADRARRGGEGAAPGWQRPPSADDSDSPQGGRAVTRADVAARRCGLAARFIAGEAGASGCSRERGT